MYRRNALSDLCESENVEKVVKIAVCFYSHIVVFTLIFNIFYPYILVFICICHINYLMPKIPSGSIKHPSKHKSAVSLSVLLSIHPSISLPSVVQKCRSDICCCCSK